MKILSQTMINKIFPLFLSTTQWIKIANQISITKAAAHRTFKNFPRQFILIFSNNTIYSSKLHNQATYLKPKNLTIICPNMLEIHLALTLQGFQIALTIVSKRFHRHQWLLKKLSDNIHHLLLRLNKLTILHCLKTSTNRCSSFNNKSTLIELLSYLAFQKRLFYQIKVEVGWALELMIREIYWATSKMRILLSPQILDSLLAVV